MIPKKLSFEDVQEFEAEYPNLNSDSDNDDVEMEDDADSDD